MKTLKEFTIWLPTEFGIGCFKKKAKDFTDAFCRISMTDKMKNGWITDEDGESQTFWQIWISLIAKKEALRN